MSRLVKPRLSRFIFDDAISLPDQKNFNSAERVIFNKIYLPDASGIRS